MTEEKQLTIAKVSLMFCIGVATIFASFLPWFIQKRVRNSLVIMSVACAFASGIILGAGLIHLQPTSQQSWDEYFETTHPDFSGAHFPFANFVAVCILLILVIIDKVFVDGGMTGDSGHNHMAISMPNNNNNNNNSNNQNHHSHNHNHNTRVETVENNETPRGYGTVATEEQPILPQTPGYLVFEDNNVEVSSSKNWVTQAYIFFVALSIHSLFDGVGLGAETTEQAFFGLMVAVIGHKLLDGFALGVPLFYAKLPRWKTVGAIVFSGLMTPLGMAIGMIATETTTSASASLLAQSIIFSSSCGSFLFISLMELLPSSLEQEGLIKTKLFFCIVGFGLMSVLAIWM